MPLDHGYGVAIGTFVSFTREDPNDFGSWYHGKLRIGTPAGQYESALDVDTPSGVGVSYRIVDDLATQDIPLLAALPDGWSPLARTSASGALDYVRSPVLLDGRRARHGWLRWVWPWRWRSFPWVSSDGDNALDVLEALLPAATRIFILGEPYTAGLGVHNVHLNQGDPPGSPHQPDDGIWQDGAVLVQRADGSVTVWQVKFNPQSLDTDDNGLPV